VRLYVEQIAAGAEIVSEPEDREWGERMAMVTTPTAT
jgi:uncharacterized glyoxalase superfamily protein PhnB